MSKSSSSETCCIPQFKPGKIPEYMPDRDSCLDIWLCNSPPEIWQYCLQKSRALGFKVLVYVAPPPHKKPTDRRTIARFHGMSVSQFQKFAIMGLVGEGHITTRNSIFDAKPFRWSDIGQFTAQKKRFDALNILAGQNGLTDGWIVPVYGPQGRVAMVSFGVPQVSGLMVDQMANELQELSQLAHLRLCQITPYLFELEKPLSKRETQIIAWAAKGKSNSEIGLILNISEYSIDSYLRRAFAKLGVNDRTSAAVKAISMDLIRI